MTRNSLLVLAVAASLTACAHSNNKPAEVVFSKDAQALAQNKTEALAAAKSGEVVCRNERKIGSHRPEKVCRTRGEIARDAENARRYRDSALGQTPGAKVGN